MHRLTREIFANSQGDTRSFEDWWNPFICEKEQCLSQSQKGAINTCRADRQERMGKGQHYTNPQAAANVHNGWMGQ